MEERRIRLTRQDPDQGRRSEAKRCPDARAFQGQRIERFGARQDVDRGPRRQGPRLEIREESGVLLGLLGNSLDRCPAAGFHLVERDARGPPARRRGIDRVAVRAGLGMAEHLIQAGFHAKRDRPLEAGRLLVRLRPAQTDDRRQEPLERAWRRKMASAAAAGSVASAPGHRLETTVGGESRNISLAAWVVTPGAGRPGQRSPSSRRQP